MGFSIQNMTEDSAAEVSVGLSEMDRLVRARQLSPQFWPWLYFRNPAGAASTIVARNGTRVVGKLGRVPLRVTADGEELIAELLEGLTLLPEFRKWNHLRSLIQASILAVPQQEPVFSFGFATVDASKLHASLGQPVLGLVPIFAGVLNGRRMLEGRRIPVPIAAPAGWAARCAFGLKRSRSSSNGFEVREVRCFGEEFDELWSAAKPARGVAVVKDAAYLNWRYVDCPAGPYGRLAAWKAGQLSGYIVWRARDSKNDGFVLELKDREEDHRVLTTLLHSALERMAERDVGLVTACFPASTAQARAMRSAGFGGWATRLQNMSLIVTPRSEGAGAELSKEAWQYSLGDWLYH